ncbi:MULTISPECIES: amino acid ABC transporter substrate-binding protein [unclassified Rhizobacter]|uniref:amino acid ABC transporter substrate-binding protein n=1 Tax=unclassified Rhizobacter TaxID=2640088 RepID=UPI0006FA6CBB|nr:MULTISPECIES: amino acid ABC transporter substrate-binding protein [unclassified Rhizobacter]KQU79429.1 amino acid ABC transporter substrate-binding protein [Rhizobacter sp. Root29]KQW05311.1 amino acid ABC transporter substrate-binding protein [Rhizobacter sp. Root1238]KRB02247.1 amino acid ABC transporter substrate-binding protein [Rhizobacter sp. Root16D2]
MPAGAAPPVAAPVPTGPVLDRIRQTGKILIAHRESSVPFSYLDADKKPVGYAVDLCLKLAEAVRKRLEMKALAPEFVLVTAGNRIQKVVDGQADLECGSTTNNAERRQKVAFTIPHYITGARYMVLADSPIAELPMFEGKKLVSTKGTTPLKEVDRANRERLLRITILEAPEHAKAMQMVLAGEADGFVMDDVLLYGLISSSADPGKLKVVGKFLTIEPLAIMMRKDDPEFKKICDEEMKRLILSREAYAIYDHWFNKPIPPKNLPLNLPMNYLLRDFWKYPSDQVPG